MTIIPHKTYSHIEEGYQKTQLFYKGLCKETPKIGKKHFELFHKKNFVLQSRANMTTYQIHMLYVLHGPELFRYYKRNYDHLSYWLTHPNIEEFFQQGLFDELKISYIDYTKKPYLIMGLPWLLKQKIYELPRLDAVSAKAMLDYYVEHEPTKILSFLNDILEHNPAIYNDTLIPSLKIFDKVLKLHYKNHTVKQTFSYIRRHFLTSKIKNIQEEPMSITSLLALGVVELRSLLKRSIYSPDILTIYQNAFEQILQNDELKVFFKENYLNAFNSILGKLHEHPWGQLLLNDSQISKETYHAWFLLKESLDGDVTIDVFKEFLHSTMPVVEETVLLL